MYILVEIMCFLLSYVRYSYKIIIDIEYEMLYVKILYLLLLDRDCLIYKCYFILLIVLFRILYKL